MLMSPDPLSAVWAVATTFFQSEDAYMDELMLEVQGILEREQSQDPEALFEPDIHRIMDEQGEDCVFDIME